MHIGLRPTNPAFFPFFFFTLPPSLSALPSPPSPGWVVSPGPYEPWVCHHLSRYSGTVGATQQQQQQALQDFHKIFYSWAAWFLDTWKILIYRAGGFQNICQVLQSGCRIGFFSFSRDFKSSHLVIYYFCHLQGVYKSGKPWKPGKVREFKNHTLNFMLCKERISL